MDAVVNWLWQGAVVGLLTVVVLQLLEASRAQQRYVICWAAMLAVLLLPLVPVISHADSPMSAPAVPWPAGPLVSIPTRWWTSNALIVGGWALWCSVSGVRLVSAMLALRRTRRACCPFPLRLESQLRHWVHVRKCCRDARLMVSDHVRAAAVLGGGSPIIAVAPALVQQLTPDELDRLVVHEWAHVQRHDDVAILVQLASLVLAGWHPAVWWLNRRLYAEREAACDEMAVAVIGSSRSYAACLVKLAGLPYGHVKALPAAGALSSPPLCARIRRIVSRRRYASPAWSRNAATASIALLAAASLTIGAVPLVEMAGVGSNVDVVRALVQLPSVPMNRLEISSNPAAASKPRAVRLLRHTSTEERVTDSAVDSRAVTVTVAVTPAATVLPSTPMSLSAASGPAPLPSTIAPEPAGPQSIVHATSRNAGEGAAQRQPVGAQAVGAWNAAANAGRAVGEGSKNTGLTTAGFFRRFGRRFAGSF